MHRTVLERAQPSERAFKEQNLTLFHKCCLLKKCSRMLDSLCSEEYIQDFSLVVTPHERDMVGM